MRVFNVRNVNEALVLGLAALKESGIDRPSRNGPVRMFPGSVTTTYERPKERVIFFPERDANPFFHFMEGLWMISGRNDVEWIGNYSSNIVNYSDNGVTFHGAYGDRWRKHFTFVEYDQPGAMHHAPIERVYKIDQLMTIVNCLKNNSDDRRTVLQMWDPTCDLGREGKDFPCNLTATFRISPYGNLDMYVFNRSNDMIWGAYGANAVHFSMLQEVMAAWIGVPIGIYEQISTNFHAYHSTLEKVSSLGNVFTAGFDEYSMGNHAPSPMVNTPIDEWFQDLDIFMTEGPVIGLRDPFFKKTVVPMYLAWQEWKSRDEKGFADRAMKYANQIHATDWRQACVEWLERRT